MSGMAGDEGTAVSARASTEKVEQGAWAWAPDGLTERAEAEISVMQSSASKWIFHSEAEWKNNLSLTRLISNFFLVQTKQTEKCTQKAKCGKPAGYSPLLRQENMISKLLGVCVSGVSPGWVLQPLWLLSKPGSSSSSCTEFDLSGFVLVFKLGQNRWSQAR